MANHEDNEGYIRDGHKVTIVVEGDRVELKLIHPEGDCPMPGLPTPGDGLEECWLKTWADNVLWEELNADEKDLTGCTLPAEIEYRATGEGEPEWRFV